MGKSRVAPTKITTIPRLELTVAVVSAKVAVMVQKELNYVNMKQYFWTDSKVVLGYINNDAKRFHTFVANRVQVIRSRLISKNGDRLIPIIIQRLKCRRANKIEVVQWTCISLGERNPAQ